MDAETVNKLLALNRAFYSQFSADFSDSRSSEHFNIEPFRSYITNDIHLLDAGCGNGRLADTLERAGYTLDYLGVDGSPELVAVAEKRQANLQKVHAKFRVVDLTAPNWGNSLRGTAPFDVIVSVAVLHHIPSFELRAQVMRQFYALLKPQGILVLSNWQFTRSEHLRKKIVGWEEIEIGDVGLETGDYLLNWKRGGTGYRYVHLVDEQEMERLARESGFHVVRQFYADADLNLFTIFSN